MLKCLRPFLLFALVCGVLTALLSACSTGEVEGSTEHPPALHPSGGSVLPRPPSTQPDPKPEAGVASAQEAGPAPAPAPDAQPSPPPPPSFPAGMCDPRRGIDDCGGPLGGHALQGGEPSQCNWYCDSGDVVGTGPGHAACYIPAPQDLAQEGQACVPPTYQLQPGGPYNCASGLHCQWGSTGGICRRYCASDVDCNGGQRCLHELLPCAALRNSQDGQPDTQLPTIGLCGSPG